MAKLLLHLFIFYKIVLVEKSLVWKSFYCNFYKI